MKFTENLENVIDTYGVKESMRIIGIMLTQEIETDETDADYQQFTLAEIENIEEKFGVTLEDWELVEVE